MKKIFLLSILINTSFAAITQEQYYQAQNLIKKAYLEDLKKEDISLVIYDFWNNSGLVTASNAYRVISLQVSGDYAQRKAITFDGFVLILCHELGHAVSYAPASYFDEQTKLGSSYEGQADYFSTLKCFKKVFKNEKKTINNNLLPPQIVDDCKKIYPQQDGFNLCKRGMLASMSFIETLGHVDQTFSLVNKDPEISDFSNPFHPDDQCRLDTLKAGLLCSIDEELSMFNALQGACHSKRNPIAARPACWFDETDTLYQEAASLIRN